ncbi:MAG: M23 family metallopeptidase [Alphaproteobacteria bacterium]|nr:M23 family metallopeptidase [Alphaproteobacteria bacterium SS10]
MGAAFVAATGASITAFTVGLTTELYLVLWSGFGAIKAQVDGNSGGFPEVKSYQTQVYANTEREQLAYQQTMDSLRPATIGFQTSAASGAGAAELNTNLARDAIMQENYEHQTNMTVGTENRNAPNAAYMINRRLEKYCSRRDAALDRCDLPEDERLIDADVDASVIEAETLDEAMIEPALDRCRNLAGHPTAALTGETMATPAGQVDMLNRASADGRALLSFAMCDYLVALRTELPEDSLKAWADEVLQRITGGVGLAPPGGSCGSYGAGSFFPVRPADCSAFTAGTTHGTGRPMTPSEASLANAVYSHMIGAGLNHEVATATAITVMKETGSGRAWVETAYTSNCPVNLRGPTVCSTSEAYVPPGSRPSWMRNSGRETYVPTGVGLIQFSGWVGDSPGRGGPSDSDGWGEGAALNGVVEKCALVPPGMHPDACTGSYEEALQNNLGALTHVLFNVNTGAKQQLRRDLANANSMSEAARIVTQDWIRPADQATRYNEIMALAGMPNNVAEGTCSFGPMASTTDGGTSSGGGGVLTRTSTGPTGGGSLPPSGGISTPLVNPLPGGTRQTDCFGYRGGRQPPRPHKAVDLVSPSGSIHAAGDGVVHRVVNSCTQGDRECGGGWGNFIEIRHPDGTMTRYAHNAFGSAQVSQGQTVRQGDRIATMGSTGWSTGAHLDFGVILADGTTINPHAVVANLPSNRVCGTWNGQQTTEWYAINPDGSHVTMNGQTMPPLVADATYSGGGGLPPTADTGSIGACGHTADLGLNIEAEHISHLQLMKMVAEYRLQDPGWVEFVMTKASRPQLVRELAAVQSIRNYMGWQSVERQIQTATVVAAWAAAEAERTYQQSDNE